MTVQEMNYLSAQVLFEEDPRVCITDSYGESCFGSYTSEMGTLWFAAILIENGNETYYTVYYGNDQDIQVVWEKHITANHESLEYDELYPVDSLDDNDCFVEAPDYIQEDEKMSIVDLKESDNNGFDYSYITDDYS